MLPLHNQSSNLDDEPRMAYPFLRNKAHLRFFAPLPVQPPHLYASPRLRSYLWPLNIKYSNTPDPNIEERHASSAVKYRADLGSLPFQLPVPANPQPVHAKKHLNKKGEGCAGNVEGFTSRFRG
jgi:hypothetical protein